MLGLERVCVFCGSSPGIDAAYAAAAEALGRHLAERGTELVYGGGAVGLMGILADATTSAGGTVTGVIPRGLFSSEVPHDHLTRLHHTATMHERKALMYELSDGFIALPGGLGTLEELFETLTWAQIGLHRKPVGLLDVNGYFDALMAFLDHAVAEAFVRRANLELLVVDADPSRLLDRLEAAEPRVPPRRRVEPEQI